MPHPSRLAVAAALAALTTLAACGAQEDGTASDTSGAGSSASSTPSPSSSAGARGGRGGAGESSTPAVEADLTVEIAGDDISPNAAELEVGVGDSMVVDVRSDRAGELHVHSTPEQYVEFEAGRSSTELTFETPGTVEVEDHDTGAVVAFVAVR